MDKKKRGRPKLPDDERLDCPYYLRLTKEDREKLNRLAKEKNLSVAEYLRKVIFEKEEV